MFKPLTRREGVWILEYDTSAEATISATLAGVSSAISTHHVPLIYADVGGTLSGVSGNISGIYATKFTADITSTLAGVSGSFAVTYSRFHFSIGSTLDNLLSGIVVDRAYMPSMYAELVALTISATGTVHNNTAILELVSPEITVYSGGYASNELVEPELTATGTNSGYNTASLELVAPELTATGTVPPTASTRVELIAPTLTGYGGGTASLELVAPELTCTGTTIQIATAALELVSLNLEATGYTGAVATVSLELAALELTAEGTTGDVGAVSLTLPALMLLATGEEAVTETTYAINLNTGAVTQLLLGAFDKLVMAHGRLYGLRSNGSLVYLGGATDEGAAIPAEIRLAPQMFGTNHPKRMSAVYLSSREDDGLYLDIVADEVAEWRYETPTDTAPAFGTHRIKTGRGIKFHTAGLRIKNRTGGQLDIGGIEALIDVLSPRPLS